MPPLLRKGECPVLPPRSRVARRGLGLGVGLSLMVQNAAMQTGRRSGGTFGAAFAAGLVETHKAPSLILVCLPWDMKNCRPVSCWLLVHVFGIHGRDDLPAGHPSPRRQLLRRQIDPVQTWPKQRPRSGGCKEGERRQDGHIAGGWNGGPRYRIDDVDVATAKPRFPFFRAINEVHRRRSRRRNCCLVQQGFPRAFSQDVI